MAIEQDASVARVLAEDDLGGRELREHAKRHVLEVPDRCRADRERHYALGRVQRLEADEGGADEPGGRAQLGPRQPHALRIGSSASRRSTSSAGSRR